MNVWFNPLKSNPDLHIHHISYKHPYSYSGTWEAIVDFGGCYGTGRLRCISAFKSLFPLRFFHSIFVWNEN